MPKYICKEKDIYKGDLILINKEHLLRANFKKDLEPFNEEYKNILYNKVANKYLQLVLKEIKANGRIVPVSGYRTMQEQKQIYSNSLKENGYEFTRQYVALPNASEHQTGLAIDLGLNMENIDFICPSFPREGICEEFRSQAIKNGFIERYTEDKESITNISAEEWHFRYVGYPHSEIINNYKLCLEEYIDYLKDKKIIYKDYEISYIPFIPNKEITLGVEDKISGNNVDGFILTRKYRG